MGVASVLHLSFEQCPDIKAKNIEFHRRQWQKLPWLIDVLAQTQSQSVLSVRMLAAVQLLANNQKLFLQP